MKSEAYEKNMVAIGIITQANAILYRDYKIFNADYRLTRGTWVFLHKDYDGDGDKRLGGGRTIEECVKLINEQIEELES